jgi:hypothetical protein
MKQFVTGFIVICILAVAGFATFKATTSLLGRFFPSPTPTVSPTPTPTPSLPAKSSAPIASPTPAATQKPGTTTTKGGQVRGTSTVTTTTTTSHLYLTLVKTNACPNSYMVEIKDIRGPLQLKYQTKYDYTARINVWRADGNELVKNAEVKGSGTLATISGVDYAKVRVETGSCARTSDDWLIVTAER